MVMPTLYTPGSLIEFIDYKNRDAKIDTNNNNIVPVQFIVDKAIQDIRNKKNKNDNPIYLLESKTGSGKSTALMRELFLAYHNHIPGNKSVINLQPRILSALTIVDDLHSKDFFPELVKGETLGAVTGSEKLYASLKMFGQTTLIYYTYGSMVASIINDGWDQTMEHVGILVLDEVHEDSPEVISLLRLINTNRHKDNFPLVICMSATFDMARFERYLNPKYGFRVEGIQYPKHIFFRNKDIKQSEVIGEIEEICREIDSGTVTLSKYSSESPNIDDVINKDVLIFVSSENEINKIIEQLSDVEWVTKTEVLGLNRQRVMTKHPDYLAVIDETEKYNEVRRIIVATPVAEVGITLSNLGYVINIGWEMNMIWFGNLEDNVLVKEPISKASWEQKIGRIGRNSPGVAINLFTKTTFDKLPDYKTNMVQRQNSASLFIQIDDLNIKPVSKNKCDIGILYNIFKPVADINVNNLLLFRMIKSVDKNKYSLTPAGSIAKQLFVKIPQLTLSDVWFLLLSLSLGRDHFRRACLVIAYILYHSKDRSHTESSFVEIIKMINKEMNDVLDYCLTLSEDTVLLDRSADVTTAIHDYNKRKAKIKELVQEWYTILSTQAMLVNSVNLNEYYKYNHNQQQSTYDDGDDLNNSLLKCADIAYILGYRSRFYVASRKNFVEQFTIF